MGNFLHRAKFIGQWKIFNVLGDGGGYKYISTGFSHRGDEDAFLETDADKRACNRFPGFTPSYGGICDSY